MGTSVWREASRRPVACRLPAEFYQAPTFHCSEINADHNCREAGICTILVFKNFKHFDSKLLKSISL
jgi:hypothetical protein